MTEREFVLYAGYGANRDPAMIEAITGRSPKVLGRVAVQGAELCVQRIDQTPTDIPSDSPAPLSVRELLEQEDNWGTSGDFETYTIREAQGKAVDATLFELTPEERALIAEWEMVEYGWYKRMQATVTTEDGKEIVAETEGLREDQEVDRVVDGTRYETYLMDKEKIHEVARKAREDYLARQAQES